MVKIKIVRGLLWCLGLSVVVVLLFCPLLDVISLYADLGETFKSIPTEEKKLLENPLSAILREEVGNGRAEYLPDSDTFTLHYQMSFWQAIFDCDVKICARRDCVIEELEKRYTGAEQIERRRKDGSP